MNCCNVLAVMLVLSVTYSADLVAVTTGISFWRTSSAVFCV